MKYSFKFSNLLGTVYRKGNLIFTKDGNSVISPVGNRISIYDLKNTKASTLPVESSYNYSCIGLSPNGNILIAINEKGEAQLINMISKRVIHRNHYNRPVHYVKFSPDGKYFAICKENCVMVYQSPDSITIGPRNGFCLLKVFHGSYDETTCIEWTTDSRVLAVGSKDMCTKIFPMDKFKNFRYCSLASHNDVMVECFFEKDSLDLITLSANCTICLWECNIDLDNLEIKQKRAPKKQRKLSEKEKDLEDDDIPNNVEVQIENVTFTEDKDIKEDESDRMFYKRQIRHFLSSDIPKEQSINIRLTCADYHQSSKILVTGFNNGTFLLYELPDINLIHSLSMEHGITSVKINSTGDWIALASPHLGQLLVWEWQSEEYILKQQGHVNNMSCLSYSPDGQYIVTGGDDGKVKLWNTTSGFCFVTFTEHTSGVVSVRFSQNRKFVVSASLDGTVRAFDLARYRNFRTFTSTRPVQFSCLDIDSGSEFVAAGCQDMFEIYLWSMKIGKLLTVLEGHEAPVSSIAFSPALGSSALASVSWDGTLRLWDAIATNNQYETIKLKCEGMCVAYRPDGCQVAVATLDADITIYDPSNGDQIGSIEGRRDMHVGRSDQDRITASKNREAKSWTHIAYSADGTCLLAGGQACNVCLYNVEEKMLLKNFTITQNHSLDGIEDFVNRRNATKWGNIALVEPREETQDNISTLKLPGTKKKDVASRSFKPELRVFNLQFSPSGESFAAASTEGLLIFSLGIGYIFDPFELEIGITPLSTRESLKERKYSRALMMALRLNDKNLLTEIIENIPTDNIELTCSSLPERYIEHVLRFLSEAIQNSRHIEFYSIWHKKMTMCHGPKLIASRQGTLNPILALGQRARTMKLEQLSKMVDFNKYTIEYIQKLALAKEEMQAEEEKKETSNEDADEDYPMMLLSHETG